jgi:hypothetical protein
MSPEGKMWYKCLNTTRGTAAVHYYDPVARLWLWGSNPYYISANVGIPIICNNNVIFPSGFTYNGKDIYITSIPNQLWWMGSTTYSLWYNSTIGWVISPCTGFNCKEYSETSDMGVVSYLGDTWWSCGSLAGTYIPRGKNRLPLNTRNNVVVTMSTPTGWTSTTMFGEYVRTANPPSGNVTKKVVGLATYSYTGGTFTQTLETMNGKPIYASSAKKMWFDGSAYIISSAAGTKDINIGYWQSSTIAGTYTRQFTAPETDPEAIPPEPESYTLTFASFIAGTNTADIYMAQEAVWL